MPSRAWPLASELPICHQGDLLKVPLWCHVRWLPTLSPERLPKLRGPLWPCPPSLHSVSLTPSHNWPPPCSWACLTLPISAQDRTSFSSLSQCSWSKPDNQHTHAAWLDPRKVMLPFLSLPRISLYPSHSNNLSLVLVSISVSCFSLL